MTYLKMGLKNLKRRRSRTVLTIMAIGLAVSMIGLFTSVSIGLKENTVQSSSIDFWVVPPGSNVMDPITGSQQTMLGNIHSEIGTLLTDSSVEGASPVLNRIVYALSNNKNEVNVVLAVGVIPSAINVMPASASGFSSGDPFFYGGGWTGEAVINQVSAELLGLNMGDPLYLNISTNTLSASSPFHIVNIIDTVEYSNYPVVVLHLSELQTMTGDLENDRANQILVQGENAYPLLKTLYPDQMILSKTEYTTHKIVSDKRILATTAAASLMAFILGMLFISTTMVMSITERKGEMALMSAIGISKFSILKIIFYESLILSTAGGITGIVMTFAGNVVLNSVLLNIFGIIVGPINDPVLLLSELMVALSAGILTGISFSLFMKLPDLSKAF